MYLIIYFFASLITTLRVPQHVLTSDEQGFIIGGKIVHPKNKYRNFMVGLFDHRRGNYCGGTLIAPDVVLTAAHEDRVSVHYGRFNVSKSELEETGAIRSNVEKIIIHPRHHWGTLENDVAIWKLRERFPDPRVRLDDGTYTRAGEMTTAIGWGMVEEYGRKSQLLREIDLAIVGHDKCQKMFDPYFTLIRKGMLCAGGEVGRDTCHGDSGGPLILKQRDETEDPILIGLVSFGIGCARRLPGVYTQVSTYLDWIQDELEYL